jgi:hypothetical protein
MSQRHLLIVALGFERGSGWRPSLSPHGRFVTALYLKLDPAVCTDTACHIEQRAVRSIGPAPPMRSAVGNPHLGIGSATRISSRNRAIMRMRRG